MPTSVRLDSETEALLRRMARSAGKSRSWVVRAAVAAYAVNHSHVRTPFEALGPYVGAGATGLTTLSDRTGAQFTEIVRAKAQRRRAR